MGQCADCNGHVFAGMHHKCPVAPAPPVDDEAACREIAYNYGMDDVCIHTAVDLLDVIREAYAAGRAAGAEQGARLMVAKPGDVVGQYRLRKKAIENGCFGWWVMDGANNDLGFISLPNLMIVAGREKGK